MRNRFQGSNSTHTWKKANAKYSLESIRNNHPLGHIKGRRDALVGLQTSKCGSSSLSLVRNHASDGAPQDFGGSAEVNGAVRRFGVHTLAEEPHVLHLLPDETSGNGYLLAPDHHHLLPVQKFLRHDRRQSTQHVVPRVHHHPLRANSGPGNHFRSCIDLTVTLCACERRRRLQESEVGFLGGAYWAGSSVSSVSHTTKIFSINKA